MSPKTPRRSKRLSEKREKETSETSAKKQKTENKEKSPTQDPSENSTNTPPQPQNPTQENTPEKEDLLTIFILNTLKVLAKDDDKVDKARKILEKEIEDEDILLKLRPFLPNNEERKKKEIVFMKPIENLQELIILGDSYDPSVDYFCNLDIKKLHRITEPLKELDNLVGLHRFKKQIIDQIICLLTNQDRDIMLHSCLYGKSGLGKSTLATILAKIYSSCGMLSKGEVIHAKREDFVGKFLGHTTIKTKELLERAKGNVLFIDEVYSLGNRFGRDSFSKEAIDCLNAFLTENYKDFICIIAGYKEDIEKCFFSVNQGLRRRFTNYFTIEDYSSDELCDMFCNFIRDAGFGLDFELSKLNLFFKKNYEKFPYFGGDIKTFVDKIKIVKSRKNLMIKREEWKVLKLDDMEEGFQIYLEERQVVPKIPDYVKMMFL